LENNELLIHNLQEVFEHNREFIFKKWSSVIINNIKMKSDFELNLLLELFEDFIDNFMNYLKTLNIEAYRLYSLKIARLMIDNRIPYRTFMQGISYFQDSYIEILVRNLEIDTICQYLILSNRILSITKTCISDEYHNIKDSTLTALVELSELRDDTTGSHVERTKDYAIALSKALKLDNDFIKDMGKASLLHDIGKVAIKDEILLKPGKLSSDEFEQIKKHTVIGAETIEKVINADISANTYLYMAKDIALCHHEKYNGTGYPNNLSGNAIPLCARVFALVDAYDVITSYRTYKKPESHKEAIKIITMASGSHFDPYIVNTFLNNQQIFENINNDYKLRLSSEKFPKYRE